jgi:DNA-binding LacI/PurR family transcriptional regulator
MPPNPKYLEVMDIIWRRIEAGDYLLNDLPGERKLAADTGVSYMTARKAVLAMIQEGMLAREANGKLYVDPKARRRKSRLDVVFLYPAYPSDHLNHCRLVVTEVANQSDVAIRPVQYVHWDDPIVWDALTGADGVLMIPSTEPIPDHVNDRFLEHKRRLVVFDGDWSHLGIPSIRLFPSSHIEALFEHVYRLGHRRIDFLNSQGHNEEINRRVSQWQEWALRRGVKGEVWDEPAPPYTDPTPFAYKLAKQLLKNRDSETGPTAVICASQPAAVATMRACYEQGLCVGRDLSIASINTVNGRYLCPSLAGLDMPNITDNMEQVFERFAKSSKEWEGPLLIEPKDPVLFEGESIAPVKHVPKPVQTRKTTTRGSTVK